MIVADAEVGVETDTETDAETDTDTSSAICSTSFGFEFLMFQLLLSSQRADPDTRREANKIARMAYFHSRGIIQFQSQEELE